MVSDADGLRKSKLERNGERDHAGLSDHSELVIQQRRAVYAGGIGGGRPGRGAGADGGGESLRAWGGPGRGDHSDQERALPSHRRLGA